MNNSNTKTDVKTTTHLRIKVSCKKIDKNESISKKEVLDFIQGISLANEAMSDFILEK